MTPDAPWKACESNCRGARERAEVACSIWPRKLIGFSSSVECREATNGKSSPLLLPPPVFHVLFLRDQIIYAAVLRYSRKPVRRARGKYQMVTAERKQSQSARTANAIFGRRMKRDCARHLDGLDCGEFSSLCTGGLTQTNYSARRNTQVRCTRSFGRASYALQNYIVRESFTWNNHERGGTS